MAYGIKWVKFWTNPNWVVQERIPKSRRSPNKLPKELVEKYWFMQEIPRSEVIPGIVFSGNADLEHLWKSDALTAPRDFYHVLAKAAMAVGCSHI